MDALGVKAILLDGLEHEGLRKYVAYRVERRAPDREAAEWLRAEHEQGRVPGWEAAWFLGAIGHEAGYEAARAILVGAPEHAESYAGVALAMIRGAGAEADLIALMNESEKKATREGAARGLMHLETPSAAHAVLDAARSGRIALRAAAPFAPASTAAMSASSARSPRPTKSRSASRPSWSSC